VCTQILALGSRLPFMIDLVADALLSDPQASAGDEPTTM
jgi:hypothetical protein